ncbi:MAG: Drug resistance protein [Acidimicrobiaceae bacterium]|nr:Drug resistance protein [Acidimicrobiaceae bacterium]
MTLSPEATRAPSSPASDASASHHGWVLAVLGTAQLMVVLDATIVNIALPSAQHALGFSNADRQWVVTAYALSFGGLLLLAGRLADMLGRKRTFLIGLVGFAAVSAIGGASNGFAMLVIARAAQGVFGALLAPSALSLLTTTFVSPSERSRAFGIYGAIAGAGGAVGLLLGGVLTEYLNWRFCLYVNVVFAIGAGIGGWVFLRDQQRAARVHLDIPGTITSVGGLVLLVYGFSQAETRSWSSPVTIGLLAASVVLLGLFGLLEVRTQHPLLPPRVIRDRGRGGANLSVLLVAVAMFGVFLFLTYYLQETLHYSPVTTGLAFLPMVGTIMIAATVGGTVLLPRIGPRLLVAPGMLFGGAGMVLMSQIAVHSTYVADVLPGLLIVGFGMGLVFGAAMNVATAGADPADAGVASALPNVAQQVGGALGPALLNTIAASATASFLLDRPHPSTEVLATASVHGDTTAFTVVYVILFASAVISWLVLPAGPIEAAEGPAIA